MIRGRRKLAGARYRRGRRGRVFAPPVSARVLESELSSHCTTDLELDARCYAIDTWCGDPHAGFYGPEVLKNLHAHHDPRYGSFSRFIQSTFDGALEDFGEEAIDLLHIDGYHVHEIEANVRRFEALYADLARRCAGSRRGRACCPTRRLSSSRPPATPSPTSVMRNPYRNRWSAPRLGTARL